MAQQKQTTKLRNWGATVFQYDSIDDPRQWPHVKFCVWQLEKGAKSGRLHLQVYVMFKEPQRMSALKKIHATAKWKPRIGTHDQCYAYHTKEETRVEGPWEFGDKPQQGKRNDLEVIRKALLTDMSMSEIADNHFGAFLKHSRGFHEYRRLHAKPRSTMPKVYVLWGPTNTGKSTYARFLAGNQAYHKPCACEWFTGYDGTSNIIINEFYGWLPFAFMLTLLDEQPLLVRIHHQMVNVNCEIIVLTSNKQPHAWYKNEYYPALKRRFFEVIEMPTLGGPMFVTEDDGTRVLRLEPEPEKYLDFQKNNNFT